jgi:hypothetical protein
MPRGVYKRTATVDILKYPTNAEIIEKLKNDEATLQEKIKEANEGIAKMQTKVHKWNAAVIQTRQAIINITTAETNNE